MLGIDKSERYGFNIYTILNKATNETIRFHGTTQLDQLMINVHEGDTVYVNTLTWSIRQTEQ